MHPCDPHLWCLQTWFRRVCALSRDPSGQTGLTSLECPVVSDLVGDKGHCLCRESLCSHSILRDAHDRCLPAGMRSAPKQPHGSGLLTPWESTLHTNFLELWVVPECKRFLQAVIQEILALRQVLSCPGQVRQYDLCLLYKQTRGSKLLPTLQRSNRSLELEHPVCRHSPRTMCGSFMLW